MIDFADTAAATEFLSVGGLMKATPVEDAGRRFLYLEASNESRDYQGEVVLTRALAESADYYLRYGNLDLDHVTVTGPRKGPADYPLYEIGRPVQVEAKRDRTFVKAELFQGDAPVAKNAILVWDSITRQKPAQRWYPSVGGAVLDRSQEVGKDGRKRVVVTKVRWTNIGLSKTPVNLQVPTVSAMPIGVFAKAWSAGGLDLTKALEMTSGGGSDVAELTGGAALQRQSGGGVSSYFDFREGIAGAVRRKKLSLSPRDIAAHAEKAMGLDPDTAADWTERFVKAVARAATPTKEKNRE